LVGWCRYQNKLGERQAPSNTPTPPQRVPICSRNSKSIPGRLTFSPHSSSEPSHTSGTIPVIDQQPRCNIDIADGTRRVPCCGLPLRRSHNRDNVVPFQPKPTEDAPGACTGPEGNDSTIGHATGETSGTNIILAVLRGVADCPLGIGGSYQAVIPAQIDSPGKYWSVFPVPRPPRPNSSVNARTIEAEPLPEQVQALSDEVINKDLLPLLAENLFRLDFEVLRCHCRFYNAPSLMLMPAGEKRCNGTLQWITPLSPAAGPALRPPAAALPCRRISQPRYPR
jgi:hypothetical protein